MSALHNNFCIFWKLSIAFIVIISSLVSPTYAKCDFKAIFNFGDSNTDTGGFYAAFPAQSGPFGVTYFKKPSGRASDGRLIVDFLGNDSALLVSLFLVSLVIHMIVLYVVVGCYLLRA